MRRLGPIVLRPWVLPLIVLVLVVPGVAAFAAVGPQLGLPVGALTVAALLVIAARATYDEPIEVARASDGRYRIMVLTRRPLDDPRTVERLVAIAAEGRDLTDATAEPELLVVAPAPASRLDRWASSLDQARDDAAAALAVSLGSLAAAGLDASGRVADPDPVQAVEDEMRGFAARELVLVEGVGLGSGQAAQIRRRLDRPVRTIGAQSSRSITAS